jgi:hypothetical protein
MARPTAFLARPALLDDDRCTTRSLAWMAISLAAPVAGASMAC